MQRSDAGMMWDFGVVLLEYPSAEELSRIPESNLLSLLEPCKAIQTIHIQQRHAVKNSSHGPPIFVRRWPSRSVTTNGTVHRVDQHPHACPCILINQNAAHACSGFPYLQTRLLNLDKCISMPATGGSST